MFESRFIACVSTAHLTPSDRSALERIPESSQEWRPYKWHTGPSMVAEYPEGFIIHVTKASEWDESRYPHLSPHFFRICRAADREGFTFLQFDADGPKEPDFEEFE
jgi:hypothetical protein